MCENDKPVDHQNLHKEKHLIQDCIKRMAHNSFLLKGWAISIVAVVLALVDKKISPYFLGLVILFPLISFWYLDAFFLYTEKLYRKLYENVIRDRPGNTDHQYDLNPHRVKDQLTHSNSNRRQTVWSVMWSKTLCWFYGIPIGLVILVFIFLMSSMNPQNATSNDSAKEQKTEQALTPGDENKVSSRQSDQQKNDPEQSSEVNAKPRESQPNQPADDSSNQGDQ